MFDHHWCRAAGVLAALCFIAPPARGEGVAPSTDDERAVESAEVSPSRGATRSPVPAYLMGGVGAVALVGGAAFIGVAQSKKSTAESLAGQTNHACPVSTALQQGQCKNLESAAAGADTFGNTGIGALVVAGVAAVGVGTYLLWPRQRPAPASGFVRVVPQIGTGGGGVVVVGTF
jgi:hypothetical protein